MFEGISRLSETQRPSRPILLQLCALVVSTGHRNHIVNKAAADLTEKVSNAGFDFCILKGQGVALYYPNPLARQCGDIDIWLGGGEKKELNTSYTCALTQSYLSPY